MRKIVFTDCTNKTYTIEENGFRYDLKDDDNNGFVTATNGTRISAMFIVEGLFNGRTKIVDKHMIMSTDVFQYTFDDYKEWCKECDVDCIYEEGSTEFYDWVHGQIDQDIDCDRENLKYSKYANREFIITGSLGLWDGHPTVEPVRINGLLEAIDKCISGRDIWDYDVFINDNEDYITVYAKHHDGTNVFKLHLLTDEGAEAYDKAYDEWNYGDDSIPFPEVKKEWIEKIEFNKIF